MSKSYVASGALVLATTLFAASCGGSDDQPPPVVTVAPNGGSSGVGGSIDAAGHAGASGSQSASGGSNAGAAGGSSAAGGNAGTSVGGSGVAGSVSNAGSGGATANGGVAGTSSSGGDAGTGANAGDGGASALGGSGGTSANAGTSGAGAGGASAGTGGGASTICDGVATATFEPPTKCDGPSGNTSTQIPSNDVYSTSWFGCYAKPDGTIVQDPSDNCEFACGSKGLCTASQSGPECEASLKWFSADADRYGCGARIQLTNCANGKSVVVAALDRGPNCGNEMDDGVPVIDMSHDAMIYLFDGEEHGGEDKARIVVEKVDPSTMLGPVD